MMKAIETRDGTSLWVAVLTTASVVTTLALACATPFASLSAVAASRMSLRAGLSLMGLSWAASQAIGFGLLGYPTDATTLAWGVAMLSAALIALVAARWGARAVAGTPAIVGLATAFGAGFVGFKATLVAWSFALGGFHTAISPYWAGVQFAREAAILAGLMVLYRGLVALGMPAADQLRTA